MGGEAQVWVRRRTVAKLLILSVVSMAVCSVSSPAGLLRPSRTFVQKRPETSELDRKLSQIADRKNLPGFSVAIVGKDGVLFQKAYGYADVERKIPYTIQSLQNIGSVSKTFISISLMQLVEQKRISLDDGINRHLPFTVVNPHFPADAITIRHLAAHTSTLKDTKEFWLNDYILQDPAQAKQRNAAKLQVLRVGNKRIPMDRFIKNIVSQEGAWYSKSNFLKNRPGSTFSYSNLGAALAAYIVERVTGENFAEYTERHIFKPIGMTHSGWSFDKVDMDRYVSQYISGMKVVPRYSIISYPDGGLITSVEDLSMYLMEMIKGFNGESTLLRKESFQEVMRPPALKPDSAGYGLFWNILPDGSIGHSGGDPGTTTYMFFDRTSLTGAILFTNLTFGDKPNNPGRLEFFDARNELAVYARSRGN